MRHLKAGKKLGRNKTQRKALKKQLASALILHEKIKTTETKAKFLKPYIDNIITINKKKKLIAKRRIFTLLNKKAAVKLRKALADKFEDRNSGYTRTTKLGNRNGDNAPIVQIELIQTNEKNLLAKKQRD